MPPNNMSTVMQPSNNLYDNTLVHTCGLAGSVLSRCKIILCNVVALVKTFLAKAKSSLLFFQTTKKQARSIKRLIESIISTYAGQLASAITPHQNSVYLYPGRIATCRDSGDEQAGPDESLCTSSVTRNCSLIGLEHEKKCETRLQKMWPA